MTLERYGIDIRNIALKEGAHDAMLKTAQNALAMQLSVEQTAQLTGLSVAEIEQVALQRQKA